MTGRRALAGLLPGMVKCLDSVDSGCLSARMGILCAYRTTKTMTAQSATPRRRVPWRSSWPSRPVTLLAALALTVPLALGAGMGTAASAGPQQHPVSTAGSDATTAPLVIPKPVSMQTDPGQSFTVMSGTRIVVQPGAAHDGEGLARVGLHRDRLWDHERLRGGVAARRAHGMLLRARRRGRAHPGAARDPKA